MNSYLERLRQGLEDATAGASEADLALAPAGKWCAAQIMEHLLLTYKGTNSGLEKCLERGTPLARRATIKDRLAVLLVVGFGHLPEGRAAPERTRPRGFAPEEVRQACDSELKKMVERLDACEVKFGTGTKITDHPFIGPLTPNQWRKFHWVHGRHHMRQIRERMGRS
jgi:hypothetical protein